MAGTVASPSGLEGWRRFVGAWPDVTSQSRRARVSIARPIGFREAVGMPFVAVAIDTEPASQADLRKDLHRLLGAWAHPHVDAAMLQVPSEDR